ncbi:MAG: methyltransferase [Actinobacteria bacterium]|nr:MAG: methyltransferase [Actinomycetota bacterium]
MNATAARLADGVATARLGTAYRKAKVLHSAVELGLFDLLAAGTAGEERIRERLGLHPRLSRAFLDALLALGLLRRDGHGYRNSAVAARFLVQDAPGYLGGAIRVASQRHYEVWSHLTEALRDGAPKAPTSGANPFRQLYENVDAARGFLAHMDAINGFVGPGLVDCLDWSRFGSFVDVGGARGNVAAQLVTAMPHLRGGVFELAALEPLFDEYMAQLGTTGRVTFHGGDFFVDPLPHADVLIFGHVLHDWSPQERQTLLDRAFEAVPAGGAVLVYDPMLDDGEPDLHSALAGLNVALMTAGGSEYTVEDCRGWAGKAGFRVTGGQRLYTVGNDYVLIAEKPETDEAPKPTKP